MKNTWFDWGMGVAAAALIGAGLVAAGVSARSVDAKTLDDNLPDPRVAVASLTSARDDGGLTSEMKRVSVLRNETLSSVLDRIGAPRAEANSAVYAASQLLDLRAMRPGDDVTAWLETGNDGMVRLTGISLRPEAETQVLVSRGADGTWTPHELKAKLSPGINYVSADVDQSIYQTALGLGAADQQVVDFADIFGYDIDFQREVQTGDHFGMLYETFEDERGEKVKTGNVLMAEFDGSALTKTFYRFTPSDDGQVDYFDETGQSAKKFLMKTPINGARLSSGFGNRRHPILGYTKLHKGTDFAAPTGTPIYAAGNGRLIKYGPNGTYGNFAKIQHANGYQTAYAHMSRFAKGVHNGSSVRQGQVIGYVGTTGRSTGPHLHYEVYINAKPVNAMALKLPTGRKLSGEQLEAFKTEQVRIESLRDAEISEQLIASATPQPAAPTGPGYSAVPVAAAAPTETRDETARP